MAGLTADANILINYAREAAQRYLLTYNTDIPCEQLVRRLCDLKQGYTQRGGLAVKVLSKTMDSTKLSSEKSEFL